MGIMLAEHDARPHIISDCPRDVPGSKEGATVRSRQHFARSEDIRCLEDKRRGFEIGRSSHRGEFDYCSARAGHHPVKGFAR